MPGEPIASIPVEITGDFSDLDTALQQSVSAAQDGGSKIAAAFNSSASSIDQWTTALENSTTASHDEVNALGQAADAFSKYNNSIENALGSEGDFLDQLQQIPKSLTEMSQRSQDAIQSLNEQTAAEAAAARASDDLGGSLGTLTGGTLDFSSALKLVGIDATARGLLNMATDALEAFNALEKGSIALEHLTGSAAGATSALNDVISVAQNDALSIPNVLQAEQRMLAFGISAKDIPGALNTIADAAAATGNNFTTVASVSERMVESGTVMSRGLVSLGINMKDLADAMGVTEGEAKKAFAALDQEDRITALEGALTKFQGTSKDVAQTIGGQWQQLANDFELTAARIGSALEKPAGFLVTTARGMLAGLNQEISNWAKVWQDVVIVVGTVTGKDVEAMKASFAALEQQLQQTDERSSTTGKNFRDAWDQSRGQVDSDVADIIDTQAKLDEAAIKAYDTWQKTITAQRQGQASLEDVTRAQADYQKALDASTPKIKDQTQSLNDMLGVLKTMDDYLKGVYDDVNAITTGFHASTQQILSDYELQKKSAVDAANAFNELIAGYDKGQVDEALLEQQLAKVQKAIDATGLSTEDLGIKLKTSGDVIPVITGKLTTFQTTGEDASSAVGDLNKQIQKLNDSSPVFDVHAAKVKATSDAYEQLKKSGTDAYEALAESGKNAVQIITDFNQAVDDSGTIISKTFQNYASIFQQMDGYIKQLTDDWNAFKNSFAQPLQNPMSTASGTGKKGGAGTTSSQGDPNTSFNTITGTGFTLPPHTHLDYSLWGIMGARVVPDPGYVVDAFGNIVPDPFLAGGPQFGAGSTNIGQTATTTAAGSTSTVAATVAAATTAVATLAPEVQALVNMGADLSQIGDLSLNVATLNTSITDLTKSVDTSSSTVASFSPVVQQATTQIAQAVQAQTAGFQRLTSIFAPPASATAANPGTPGSFMITTPNAPTSGPVTYNLNLNGQAQPNASSVLTDVVALLQRRGIRF